MTPAFPKMKFNGFLSTLRRFVLTAIACTILAPGIQYAADSVPQPFVSPIFGDHMVLQRGKPNTLWGWSQRFAFVGATGGHFAGIVSMERLRRAMVCGPRVDVVSARPDLLPQRRRRPCRAAACRRPPAQAGRSVAGR